MMGVPLPPGVVRRPGRPAGIAGAGRFVEVAPSAGYAPSTEVAAEAWAAAVKASPDYAALLARGKPAPAHPAVTAIAAHRGAPPMPEIGVVADLPLSDGTVLLGSSLGHTVEDVSDNRRTQAVLEFHGYAACVVDIAGEDNVELWVAEPGGKVAIQSGPTHVTVYNLDEVRSPLLTLTAYDPRRTRFSPKLAAGIGPVFAAHYVPEREAVFTLNSAYVNRPGNDAGVRLAQPPTEAERTVRIPLRPQLELGAYLYSQIFENPEVVRAFVRLNVRVLPAPGGVELGPAPGEKADLRDRRHLVPAIAHGRPLHKRLFG